jgi:hypothetical protein
VTTDTEPRHTKAELLAKIDTAYRELDGLTGPLSEQQMTTPGGPDGWSVKDHLTHLSAWHRSLIALLEGKDRTAALGLDEQAAREAEAQEGFDPINDLIYRAGKDRALAQVQADFRATRQRVLDILGAMTDEDLYRPYSHYQRNDPEHNPNPVIGWIAGNTFGHVEEHLEWIRALLNSK